MTTTGNPLHPRSPYAVMLVAYMKGATVLVNILLVAFYALLVYALYKLAELKK